MFFQSNEHLDSRKYIELLDQYENDEPDPDELASETSKYLGLSSNSQQLIVDFHTSLTQNAPGCMKLFEEICYSFLEDIQKYKKDIRRIEHCYKKEKDKNEETMKHMIEEAEQQMNSLVEKVKLEQKAEYEKIMDKMRQEYESELSSLQESIESLKEEEKKLREYKVDENIHFNKLKNDLDNIKSENKDLKLQLRESKTEASILRSEVTDLRVFINEKHNNHRNSIDTLHEINILRNQINALNEANKKLNDNNDILINELDTVKTKRPTLIKGHAENEIAKQIALTTIYCAINKEKGTPTDAISKRDRKSVV